MGDFGSTTPAIASPVRRGCDRLALRGAAGVVGEQFTHMTTVRYMLANNDTHTLVVRAVGAVGAAAGQQWGESGALRDYVCD